MHTSRKTSTVFLFTQASDAVSFPNLLSEIESYHPDLPLHPVRTAMRYYLQISAFAPITEIEVHIVPPISETRQSFATGFSTTGYKT